MEDDNAYRYSYPGQRRSDSRFAGGNPDKCERSGYEKAKAQLEQLRTTKAAQEAQAEAIGAFMFEMQELDTITEFDEKLWLTTIDTVTVHADGRMTFKFQGGKTLTSY